MSKTQKTMMWAAVVLLSLFVGAGSKVPTAAADEVRSHVLSLPGDSRLEKRPFQRQWNTSLTSDSTTFFFASTLDVRIEAITVKCNFPSDHVPRVWIRTQVDGVPAEHEVALQPSGSYLGRTEHRTVYTGTHDIRLLDNRGATPDQQPGASSFTIEVIALGPPPGTGGPTFSEGYTTKVTVSGYTTPVPLGG